MRACAHGLADALPALLTAAAVARVTGIQVCASNHLDGTCTGHAGRVYGPNAGLCLETQHYPDSVNHAHFPSTVLKPGHVFSSRTVYAFSASASSTEHA